MKFLSAVARISLVYDLAVGIVMLAATDLLATVFGVPPPTPILFAKLLGLFLICVGLGYIPAIRNPEIHRGYLWIFGPLLKGAGAVTFIVDYVINASPRAFLLFAATDGTLAALTLWGLLSLSRERPRLSGRSSARP
ncbi:MAG: hypothetical protein EPO35_13240 [Acidobacteria bacterium]|nr:MAG: hypothetical protein EPO35_13240 [Acidobacteriota bacterium]